LHRIGKGASGHVYQVRSRNTQQKYAMKVAELSLNNTLELLKIEVGIMRMCVHPNIVSCYDSFYHLKYVEKKIKFAQILNF
jgi:serine/threonine protein kinase